MTAPERVRQLAALLEGTGIGLLELTTAEGVIRLRRDGAVAAATPAINAEPVAVRAPSVGVFRTRHPSLDQPLAEPGRQVAAGDAVGLVQVGALLLHVSAPADGVLLDLVAADGDMVGYGTPLMRMELRE